MPFFFAFMALSVGVSGIISQVEFTCIGIIMQVGDSCIILHGIRYCIHVLYRWASGVIL